MKTSTPSAFGGYSDGRHDAGLLRRLGAELALVYHDTVHASLPSRIQALADQLEHTGQTSDRNQDESIEQG